MLRLSYHFLKHTILKDVIIMKDSVFKVGDTIQLVGPQWNHYCSKQLLGKFREVIDVEEDGSAVFIVVTDSNGGYCGWASPRADDDYFASIVE
jgi:hypothetical protein